MFPIHSGTAQTIANVFRKEILTRWVVPDILISDRGTEFVSEIFKEVCCNKSGSYYFSFGE